MIKKSPWQDQGDNDLIIVQIDLDLLEASTGWSACPLSVFVWFFDFIYSSFTVEDVTRPTDWANTWFSKLFECTFSDFTTRHR